jgi:hypothetical protein
LFSAKGILTSILRCARDVLAVSQSIEQYFSIEAEENSDEPIPSFALSALAAIGIGNNHYARQRPGKTRSRSQPKD